MSLPTTTHGKRILQLDGIRGIAIAMILIWHYYMRMTMSDDINLFKPFLTLAWSGVDLFFVLSGFLIGGILMDNRSAGNLYSVFYTRRVFRILPIYFVLLIPFAVILISGIWQSYNGMAWLFKNAFPVWSYATFLQNFFMIDAKHFGPHWMGISWSLAIEEQFYLIMPLMIRLLPPKKLPFILLIGIIGALATRILLLNVLPSPQAEYACFLLLPARADALLVGVLVAWMIRQPGMLVKLKSKPLFLNAPLIILGSGMLFLAYLKIGPGHTIILTSGLTWMAAFYGALILFVVVNKNSVLSNILCFNPLRGLGTVSYCVYLFHPVFLGLLHAFLLRQMPQLISASDIGITLLALLVTIGFAMLSYRFFEKPLIQFGHRRSYAIANEENQ